MIVFTAEIGYQIKRKPAEIFRGPCRFILYSLVSTAYEVVLKSLIQFDKVGGEAGYAYNKVAVAVRVLLGFSELFRAHDVVLNMHSVHVEIGFHQAAELCVALVPGNGCGVEFHVQKCTVRKRTVRNFGHAV